MSLKKIAGYYSANSRLFLPLMVNVSVPVSYQLSTRSGGGHGIGNAMTWHAARPQSKQTLFLARSGRIAPTQIDFRRPTSDPL
jgi:hypothetical protein